MSFRRRLLIAFVIALPVPLAVFGLGVRREVDRRLTAQYEARVNAQVQVLEEDLARAADQIAAHLAGLRAVLMADNRFRQALLAEEGPARAYRLDYATRAMAQMGLDMLVLQEEDGRVLSSGHFRNAYDTQEPLLARRLAAVPGGAALVRVRTAGSSLLVLAAGDSLSLLGRRVYLAGGFTVDEAFLSRLARSPEVVVTLETGEPEAAARVEGFRRTLEFPLLLPEGVATARFVAVHPLTPLLALRRSIDRWFLLAALVAVLAALLPGVWLSARLSRPLRALAARTASLDLDRLDVDFATEGKDEVGALSRLLAAMTERLRASAQRLRDAERRAAMGDMARQVNHDIKNGLAPIRNVVRHLAQAAEAEPARVPELFRERRGTLESAIGYLEELAARYARMRPVLVRESVRVHDLLREVVSGAARNDPRVILQTATGEPTLGGDPLALRRIVENLVQNARDSLEPGRGSVVVRTERVMRGDGEALRLVVEDDGAGVPEADRERIFEDFYTSKSQGTGLGLSIVRRLAADLGGSVALEARPGPGSRFVVLLPLETTAAPAEDGARRS